MLICLSGQQSFSVLTWHRWGFECTLTQTVSHTYHKPFNIKQNYFSGDAKTENTRLWQDVCDKSNILDVNPEAFPWTECITGHKCCYVHFSQLLLLSLHQRKNLFTKRPALKILPKSTHVLWVLSAKKSVCKEKALKENVMTLKLFKTNLQKNSVMPLLIRVFVTFRVSHFS